jgi:hypothetical protein
MADDHSFVDSTVFGSKQVRTANMERIAKAQGDEGRVLVEPRRLDDPQSWQTPLKIVPKKKDAAKQP